MIPDRFKGFNHRWWDTRVEPPGNRRDSFKVIANKKSNKKRRKK